LGQKKTKIFLQEGLDSQISDLPIGKFVRHSGARSCASYNPLLRI
jgi:hypothetical protein